MVCSCVTHFRCEEILWVSDGNEESGIFEKELTAMHHKVQVIINKEQREMAFLLPFMPHDFWLAKTPTLTWNALEENKGLIVSKMETAARAQAPVPASVFFRLPLLMAGALSL